MLICIWSAVLQKQKLSSLMATNLREGKFKTAVLLKKLSSVLLYGCITWTFNKMLGEKARW